MADSLEIELQSFLEGVSTAYLNTLSYPVDDWYGLLERKNLIKIKPKFASVSHHRIREIAVVVKNARSQ